MKTILFTFALPFAMCAAAGASAQTKSAPATPKADTVMISQTTQGDYLVRRYVVNSNDDAGYSLLFKISTWKLAPTFDDNTQMLAGLDKFIVSIDQDSLMKVHSVAITGYASPDGPTKLNQKLAQGRAQSLHEYVDKRYNLSAKYDVKVNFVASDWGATREAIVVSDLSNKEDVLRIIDQRDAASAKEQRLKDMPDVWRYLVSKILPPMRYSEVSIIYQSGRVVEQRTAIPQPEPVVEPCEVDPCCCVDVYESVSGVVVEMEDVGVDFKKR